MRSGLMLFLKIGVLVLLVSCTKRIEVKPLEAAPSAEKPLAKEAPIEIPAWAFGAVGDGTTDDTEAIQAAIDSGNSIRFPKGIYRITRRLFFRMNDVTYSVDGKASPEATDQSVVLLFDGPFTERLAHISGKHNVFRGITFSGGHHQVAGTLIYVPDDAAGLRFENCRFRAVRGTHADGTYVENEVTYLKAGSYSGNQYALMISPYGVTDFVIRNCTFEDITNDNTGLNGAPQQYGSGFVGGIFFIRDDIGPRDVEVDLAADAPYVPTSGIIEECLFSDIATILPPGLHKNTAVEHNDADAIRTYGAGLKSADPGLRLPVTIRNTRFVRVGKRAIKTARTAGITVENITIDARGLPYAMASAIRLSDDMKVNGVHVLADEATPVHTLFDSYLAHDIDVRNVTADNVFVLWTFVASPGNEAEVLRNITADNFTIGALYWAGLYASAVPQPPGVPVPYFGRAENIRFSNFKMTAATSAHGVTGVSGPLVTAHGGDRNLSVEGFDLKNMDFKLSGKGWTVRNVTVTVDDASFAGYSPTRGLVEIGTNPGTGDTGNLVEGLHVNVKSIPPNFLNATRQYGLVVFYGDGAYYGDIRIDVPTSLQVGVAHLNVYGSRVVVNGFDYTGAGGAWVSTTGYATYSDVQLYNWRRHAPGDGPVRNPFLYMDKGSRHTLSAFTDCGSSDGVYSLRLMGGVPASPSAYAYHISNVTSRSPLGAVYDFGYGPSRHPLASLLDVTSSPAAAPASCDD